jgi:DeoR family deoxyribose operon repressor
MQNKLERTSRVVDILRERNGASIKELARELAVSEMTIRRDLAQLRLDNAVSLVHGAAIFKSNPAINGGEMNYQVSLEKVVNNPEKERIGKAAARMVETGDTIIIDIGTTTECVARHLPPEQAVTVLCFTMNTLAELYKKKVDTLIMGGGYFHPDTRLFESMETISLIHRTRATKFFLSAAGVSRDLGLTTVNQYEVNIKQTCITSSRQKILLVDAKKFDRIRPAYFAPLEKMDMVITDDRINPEWVRVMEDMGITVQVV